jgi:hypothetical protein
MHSRRTPLEALVDNLNVEAMAEIPSPQDVQERLPLTERAAQTVLAGRNAVRAISSARTRGCSSSWDRARCTIPPRRSTTRRGCAASPTRSPTPWCS